MQLWNPAGGWIEGDISRTKVKPSFQDTYQAENPDKFEEVQDEEAAKKRQRVQQFR